MHPADVRFLPKAYIHWIVRLSPGARKPRGFRMPFFKAEFDKLRQKEYNYSNRLRSSSETSPALACSCAQSKGGEDALHASRPSDDVGGLAPPHNRTGSGTRLRCFSCVASVGGSDPRTRRTHRLQLRCLEIYYSSIRKTAPRRCSPCRGAFLPDRCAVIGSKGAEVSAPTANDRLRGASGGDSKHGSKVLADICTLVISCSFHIQLVSELEMLGIPPGP